MRSARSKIFPASPMGALVLLFAGIGILGVLAASARAQAEGLLRVGIPREGLGQFANQKGDHLFDVVLDHLEAEENWHFEKVPVTFADGVDAIVRHDIELLVAIPHPAARSGRLRVSKEAVFTTWAQVCLAAGVEAQSLLDLGHLRVGIVRDDYFANEVQRLTAGLDIPCQFIEFNSSKEMFGALSSGWIQAGVTDRLFVENESDAYDIVKTSIYFAPLKYHFATARDISPAIIDTVDYHLKQLKDDPQSVYHRFIESVFHAPTSSRIPRVLKWCLMLAAAVSLLMVLANAVLRRQVRAKTRALADNNLRLEEELLQRARAEEDLRRSEEKYRLLIEHASDGILIVQRNTIRYGNPSACRIAGVSNRDLIGRDIADFLHPEDRRYLRTGGLPPNAFPKAGHRPFRVINHAGETLWIETATVDIEWEERLATLCFIRDITQTKKLEEKLLQSQKLQAIGTLAGGIAHDFNNLLAAIMGFTELSLHSLPAEDPCRANLNHVMSASERAKSLIQRILTFSRQQKKDLKPVSLAPLVSEALELLRASLPTTIAIQAELADDTGIVMTEPSQINQIVMNLCTNGAHAMEGRKGVLRIGLEACRIEAGTASACVDLPPGRYACLSVADDGKGMDRETQKKIFDPYFTTKKIGEGTGLGLSVVHGIVRTLGGTIAVYSEPGQGSTFRIYLPIIDDADPKAAVPAKPPETGSEHILLVDDEDLVLEMLAGMLANLGYAVTRIADSRKALEAFEADPGRYDLVITDQTMPGLTGLELAREIRRCRPDTPIILCSGFSAGFTEERDGAGHLTAHLHKPVLMQDLARTVRIALAPPN